MDAPRSDAEAPPATPAARAFPAGGAMTVALFGFLLFLGFPLADTLAAGLGTVHLVLVLLGLATFVALYLWVMLEDRGERATVAALVAMTALALAVALDDSAEWSPMFIYVSAASGMRLAMPYGWRAIAAATAVTAAISFGFGYPVDDSVSYVIYALAIGALLRGYAYVVTLNAELSAARDEIARLAVGEERLRFARDLHDLLGHSLSVIALKSELARRLLATDAAGAEREVRDIETVTRDALVEVREAVGGYRRMTLAAELRGAQAALDAAGIAAEVSRPEVTFAPEVEAVLAWAVREGTTNVIRHSGARSCAIRVHAGLHDAGVEIVDDGTAEPPAAAGSGLAGLEERVQRRAGRLEAGRRPGGGFRLAVDLPAQP